MKVTCESCGTAYDFDDALVSERGTTVRCTNCNYQFKVRAPSSRTGPERWLVRTMAGEHLEFRALRELQAAITARRVARTDFLTRGAGRPRRIGDIAELEPFFPEDLVPESDRSSPPPPPPTAAATTLQSVGGSQRAPLPKRPQSLPPPLPPKVPTLRPGHPDDRRLLASISSAPPPAAELNALHPLEIAFHDFNDHYTPSVPFEGSVRPPPSQHPPESFADWASVEPEPTSQHPPRSYRSRPATLHSGDLSALPSLTPTPPSVKPAFEDAPLTDQLPSAASSRRAGAVSWIFGVLVVGALALGVTTVVRRYLAPPPPSNGMNERVVALLNGGEKSYFDGDLEAAKEQLDKASALAEHEPKVAVDLARVAVARADIDWLRVRLLPDGDPEATAAKSELDQAAERASKAAEQASALAPGDPVAVRARVDALRLAGDVPGARRLSASLTGDGAVPENALALAELDLTDANPVWPTVLSRLRTALTTDQGLGRARSFLVYALARSGDASAARAELDRLAKLSSSHPLLQRLKAFVAGRPAPAPSASSSAAAPAASASAKSPPAAARPPVEPSHNRVPDDYVYPTQNEPSPAPTRPPPPPVDTADLPGFK